MQRQTMSYSNEDYAKPAGSSAAAPQHPPATARQWLGFTVAELAIVGTVVTVLLWVFKEPGPLHTLAEAGAIHVYSHYNAHAVLMTCSFVFFMFNSILAFRLFPGSHAMRKGVHLVLHTIAFAGCVVAVILMIIFHGKNKIPNFYSVHSIIGVITLGLFAIQWMMGFMTFFMPCSPTNLRKFSAPIHKFFGGCIMVATAVTMVLGAFDRQRISWELGPASVGYFNPTDKFGNAFAVLVLVACAAVAFVLHPASRAKAKEHDEPASAPYTAMDPHA